MVVLRDYSIIGMLALRWVERADFSANAEEAVWVMENLFSVAELEELGEKHPGVADLWPRGDMKEFVSCVQKGGTAPAELESKIETAMHLKVAALQRADREYWKPIIAELRAMRMEERLMAEGAAV